MTELQTKVVQDFLTPSSLFALVNLRFREALIVTSPRFLVSTLNPEIPDSVKIFQAHLTLLDLMLFWPLTW